MTTRDSEATIIDSLRVASPCPISWEQMSGDNRIRFCDHCQLNVYNISALSRSEAESLIASTEGRMCARLYRRADGTILTNDCPVGLRALRMRMAKRVAAVFAAIVSVSSLAIGQQTSGKGEKKECTPQVRISRTNPTSDSVAEVLSGTILDPNGAAIPGVLITLTNLSTQHEDTTTSSDAGRFEFKSVVGGSYSIKIEHPGFKTLMLKNIDVESAKLTNMDIILEVGQASMTVGVLSLWPSLIDTPPGTTIINEKLIRRLPIQ